MTAAVDITHADALTGEPVRITDGSRMMIRGAQRLFGASLALAAVGLWLAPGSSWESDVMLFKMALSIAALLTGFGLMTSSARPLPPEVQIDTIRREVRLIRRIRGSNPALLQSCSFRKLANVELEGTLVRFWDNEGVFLAEISLTDREVMKSLVRGLQDAGKLA